MTNDLYFHNRYHAKSQNENWPFYFLQTFISPFIHLFLYYYFLNLSPFLFFMINIGNINLWVWCCIPDSLHSVQTDVQDEAPVFAERGESIRLNGHRMYIVLWFSSFIICPRRIGWSCIWSQSLGAQQTDPVDTAYNPKLLISTPLVTFITLQCQFSLYAIP